MNYYLFDESGKELIGGSISDMRKFIDKLDVADRIARQAKQNSVRLVTKYIDIR